MRYYAAKGSVVVELHRSKLGRWSVRTSGFPSMALIEIKRFGWDRAKAIGEFKRMRAVEEAIKALGVLYEGV